MALALVVSACGGASTTGTTDSTTVTADTVVVLPGNPDVQGEVPKDTVK
jgi:hypothetical protein